MTSTSSLAEEREYSHTLWSLPLGSNTNVSSSTQAWRIPWYKWYMHTAWVKTIQEKKSRTGSPGAWGHALV